MDAESLFAEFLARREADKAYSLNAFIVDHPNHEAKLREEWSNFERLEDIERHMPAGDDDGLSIPLIDMRDAEMWHTPAVRQLVEELSARRVGAEPHDTLERFAKGGMAELRDGWDPVLKRRVAVKRILPAHQLVADAEDRDALESLLSRFVNEAQITAQLDHPGVIPIYDAGLDSRGQLYITMPKVEGQTLRKVFEQHWEGDREWTLPRVLGVLVRICETISFAHSRGIVHRDLTPENVMIGVHGETYILDWGLATAIDDGGKEELLRVQMRATDESLLLTQQGAILGKFGYMSGDQARSGVAKPSWDVFALGAMLYELLSGKRPYSEFEDVKELIKAMKEERLRPLLSMAPDAPAELVAISECAMGRRDTQRFDNASTLGDQLRAYLEGRVVGVHDVSPLTALKKWAKRNPAVSALAGAAVLAVILALTSWATVRVQNSTILAQEADIRTNEADIKAKEADLVTTKAKSILALTGQRAFESAKYALVRGDYDTCIDELDRAIDVGQPDSVEGVLLRADALAALERFGESRALLLASEARSAAGSFPMTEREEGALLVSLATAAWADSEAEALENDARLDRALTLDLGEADRSLALAYSSDHTAIAIEHFKDAVREEPFHRRAYVELVSLLFLSGRFNELEQEAEIFVKMFPKDPTPYLALALASVVQQDRDLMAERVARLDGLLGDEQLKGARRLFDALYDIYSLIDPDLMFSSDASMGLTVQKAISPAVQVAKSAEFLGGLPQVESPLGLRSLRAIQAICIEVSEELKGYSDLLDLASVADVASLISLTSSTNLTSITTAFQATLVKVRPIADHHSDGMLTFWIKFGQLDGLIAIKDRDERHAAFLAYIDEVESIVEEPTIIPACRHLVMKFALELRVTVRLAHPSEEVFLQETRQTLEWFASRPDLGKSDEPAALCEIAQNVGHYDLAIYFAQAKLKGANKVRAADLRRLFRAELRAEHFPEAKRTLARMRDELRRAPKDIADLEAELAGAARGWFSEAGF